MIVVVLLLGWMVARLGDFTVHIRTGHLWMSGFGMKGGLRRCSRAVVGPGCFCSS